MKKWQLAIGFVAAVGCGYVAANHGVHSSVMYAEAIGNPKTPNVRGSMVFVTLPNGNHEVFVRVSGLEPNSGVYANHVHFSNQILNSSCEGQNGEDAIPLRNIVADARGVAMGYTFFAAEELANLPKGKLYFNVHSNKPQPVGEYVTCGNVSVLNSGTPQ